MQRPSPFAPPRRACALQSPLLLPALALFAVLSASCGPSGASESGERGLVIQNGGSDPDRPYFHDFGSIPEGEVVSHTYELLNTDPRTVTIERVTPACSCTIGRIYSIDRSGARTEGDVRGEPVLSVPPGAIAYIEFQLDSRQVPRKNVDKLATVALACDSPNTPYMHFEMHSVVEVALQASPLPLDLKDLAQSTGGTGATQVVPALPMSSVEVRGILSASGGLEASIEASAVFGERVWVVTVHAAPGLALGPLIGEVKLSVSGADGTGEGRPFTIPVRGRIVEDVVVQPSVLGFGEFSAEEGARAQGVLQAMIPGERVKVIGIALTGERAEELAVEVEAVDPDAVGRSSRWRVALVAPPSLAGASFTGTLRIELDHPSIPAVEARFVARPR